MGFGGSTSGANVSLKNNRRERKSKISKFKNTTGSNIEGINSSTKASAEDIEKIRIKIATENNKRQQKIILITAGILLLLFSAFIYFFFIF